MMKFIRVFSIVIALVVLLVAPVQAYEDDSEHPDPMCPVFQIEDSDDSSDFETWGFHEILPEDPDHSLLHEALGVNFGLHGDLCKGALCMIGINTGGPGVCHDNVVYPCKECVRWEMGPVEPFCAESRWKICVHRKHCDSWD